MRGMPRISPLVRAPHVQDLGLRPLHLHLQRRDERVVGVNDRVIRLSIRLHPNGELHFCGPWRQTSIVPLSLGAYD